MTCVGLASPNARMRRSRSDKARCCARASVLSRRHRKPAPQAWANLLKLLARTMRRANRPRHRQSSLPVARRGPPWYATALKNARQASVATETAFRSHFELRLLETTGLDVVVGRNGIISTVRTSSTMARSISRDAHLAMLLKLNVGLGKTPGADESGLGNAEPRGEPGDVEPVQQRTAIAASLFSWPWSNSVTRARAASESVLLRCQAGVCPVRSFVSWATLLKPPSWETVAQPVSVVATAMQKGALYDRSRRHGLAPPMRCGAARVGGGAMCRPVAALTAVSRAASLMRRQSA